MKIYKVSIYSKQDSSVGFSFHASKSEAKKALKEYRKQAKNTPSEHGGFFDDFDGEKSKIEPIEYPISKKGLLDALNRHGKHNDNG